MEAHNKRLSDFEDLLNADVIDYTELSKKCFQGCPDVKGMRSLSWKLMLYYLPQKKTEWDDALNKQRRAYKSFIEEMIIKPGSEVKMEDSVSDHPLNPNPDSQWSQYFKDNEMLLQIDKDCRRLYPDLVFFQSATEYPCLRLTQSVNGLENLRKRVENTFLESHTVSRDRHGITKMHCTRRRGNSSNEFHTLGEGEEAHWEVVERMLFIYAKLNPGIQYVQGMNEILGPLYYTMATDPNKEWAKHAEADSFYCFTNLMAEIRDNFIKSLDDSLCGIGGNMHAVMRSLQNYEPRLHQRLMNQSIKPEFFAFRWITLLLSQEFQLPDVLRIWDALFSDKHRFRFLVDICCSMIILVRKDILQNDFAGNMKLLQNYPPTADIESIITTAAQLRQQ
ncbi:TBC1 domain family member 13-like [Watersipora subatra]|uniref:TBC1 domain family member 13-like n=1 Tax=Watersipora subatra TaxID=2589382 RepID=UPI00355C5EDB